MVACPVEAHFQGEGELQLELAEQRRARRILFHLVRAVLQAEQFVVLEVVQEGSHELVVVVPDAGVHEVVQLLRVAVQVDEKLNVLLVRFDGLLNMIDLRLALF